MAAIIGSLGKCVGPTFRSGVGPEHGGFMKPIVVSLAAGITLGFGAGMFAAPQQIPQGADRPGVVMQPNVKVDNRGIGEAIPVSVQEWPALTRPMPVQVTGP